VRFHWKTAKSHPRPSTFSAAIHPLGRQIGRQRRMRFSAWLAVNPFERRDEAIDLRVAGEEPQEPLIVLSSASK